METGSMFSSSYSAWRLYVASWEHWSTSPDSPNITAPGSKLWIVVEGRRGDHARVKRRDDRAGCSRARKTDRGNTSMTSGGGGAIERASEEGRGDILQMTFQIDFSARNSSVLLGADGEGRKPAVHCLMPRWTKRRSRDSSTPAKMCIRKTVFDAEKDPGGGMAS